MSKIQTIDAILSKEFSFEKKETIKDKKAFNLGIKLYKLDRLEERLIPIQEISMILDHSKITKDDRVF